jgi:uncharacterized protein (TIGR02147 family)
MDSENLKQPSSSVSAALTAAAANAMSLFSDAPAVATPAPEAKTENETRIETTVGAATPALTESTPAMGILGANPGPVMPSFVEAPVISDYLDFRKLLSDYYQHRRELSKKDIRPYNYAVFSAAANIKSPNYLKLIIEGKRNLSPEMIGKFAKALSYNKEQAEEFKLLVLFGQASDPGERNMHLKALNENRVNTKLKSGEIDQKTWEKIPSWIAWILYSMVDQKDVKFDAESLRETLRNKASADEIQAALNSLMASGELVKDEATGGMKKARALMESAEDIPVALVRKLQGELMYLGLESLYQDSATDREFGSATLAMTKAEFEDLRFHLRKIRKETQKNIGVKRLSSKGERVYQLNLQLFPITK